MAETFTPSPDFADVGGGQTIERDGFTIRAKIVHDPHCGEPWKAHDGHGPVSDWRPMRSKRPGEWVLNRDGESARFYDMAEAAKIARRDGWGCEGGRLEGESARQYAARAALADFKRLKAWCNDEWTWAGVVLEVERAGVTLTDRYAHALWGIESDAGDYFAEVANDLLSEALDAARAKLAELAA